MSIDIRPAKIDDVSTVLGFVKDLAAYEKLADDCIAVEDDLIATLFCDEPKAFALLVSVNGEDCGVAIYYFTYSTFLGRHGIYLEDLYVSEAARGHGAGKALIKALAKIAVENDCKRLEWQVLDWNAPSIAFYESLGADRMAGWYEYRIDGDDLPRMAAE